MKSAMVFLQHHWAQVGVLFGIIGTPFIAHMPQRLPRSLDEWWTWLRDSLQQMVNAKANNAPK